MEKLIRLMGTTCVAMIFLMGLIIQGAEAQVIQMKFAHYAEETHPGSSGGEAVCGKSGRAYQRASEDCHLPC